MNLKQRIARYLFKAGFEGATSIPRSWLWTVGRGEWDNYDFNSYITSGFLANPYLYSAIDMIMTSIKGIRVNPMLKVKNEELVDMPVTHPAYGLITKPCPLYPSSGQWAAVMAGYRLLGGSAFALAMGPEPLGTSKPTKPPIMLHPLGPNCIAAKPAMNANRESMLGFLGGFEYAPSSGSKIALSEQEVLWFNSWNPENEYKGTSVCKPGEKTLDTNNAARNYNKAILDNGGSVGMVFTTDNPDFGREQALQAQESFDDKYKGSGKAGKTFFAWGGIKPFKVGLAPAEMGFEQLINLTAREVGVITHVPPQLLGDTSVQTYANYGEAREGLYTEAVLPILVDLCNVESQFLSMRFGDEIVLSVDIDSITALSGQREKSKDSVRKDFQAGLITKTEARQEIGWSAEDDGGEYYSGQQPMILKSEGKSWTVFPHRNSHKCKGHS